MTASEDDQRIRPIGDPATLGKAASGLYAEVLEFFERGHSFTVEGAPDDDRVAALLAANLASGWFNESASRWTLSVRRRHPRYHSLTAGTADEGQRSLSAEVIVPGDRAGLSTASDVLATFENCEYSQASVGARVAVDRWRLVSRHHWATDGSHDNVRLGELYLENPRLTRVTAVATELIATVGEVSLWAPGTSPFDGDEGTCTHEGCRPHPLGEFCPPPTGDDDPLVGALVIVRLQPVIG